MNSPKIIALIIALVLFAMVYHRKKANAVVNDFIMDIITKKKIAELHPAVQHKAVELVKRAERAGIHLRIYSALRSFAQQTALFNQPFDLIDNDGDKLIDEKDEKVTNARAGESFHNYGLAFDVVEIKDGKALWNNPNWERIGELGESVGLEWGGRWKFVDKPHFQILDFALSHAKRNYAAEKFDSKGFILLT